MSCEDLERKKCKVGDSIFANIAFVHNFDDFII